MLITILWLLSTSAIYFHWLILFWQNHKEMLNKVNYTYLALQLFSLHFVYPSSIQTYNYNKQSVVITKSIILSPLKDTHSALSISGLVCFITVMCPWPVVVRSTWMILFKDLTCLTNPACPRRGVLTFRELLSFLLVSVRFDLGVEVDEWRLRRCKDAPRWLPWRN